MRRIVLDTETTGLSARLGDRILELGCVEIVDRRLTGNHFHRYVNPERESETGALKVHGITVEFLHQELALLELPPIEQHCAAIVDTLALAKGLHPGKRNSLDALCERYRVEHSHRTLHGALLDAELLAEVYLAMTRGQESLGIELEPPGPAREETGEAGHCERLPLLVPAASADEMAAHEAMLGRIETDSKGRCLWRRLETS